MCKRTLVFLLTIIMLFATFAITTYAVDTTKSTTKISTNVCSGVVEETTAFNVVLKGIINNPQKKEISEYGFYFGDSPKKITYKMSELVDSSIAKLSYKFDFMNETDMKLSPKTKYYYRSYVVIEDDTYYGKVESFITKKIEPWKNINGFIYDDDYKLIPKATKIGIDVSFWQGKIDWEKVKKDSIDFAIIRCGFGSDKECNDDSRFIQNVNGCTKNKIPFGVYIYSYATSIKDAEQEAKHVLRLIKGLKLDFPVYYDLEDESIKHQSNKELAQIAEAFCSIIQKAGYETGIYANSTWWKRQLTDKVFKDETWNKWLAAWDNKSINYNDCDMWQYSSEAKINGIDGNVDINLLFENNPNCINFKNRAQKLKPMAKQLVSTISKLVNNP